MIKKRRKTDPEILYQWHPNGVEKCALCAMFRPSAACSAVQGTIDRGGWCRIYESKNTLGIRK